jgi:predicted RNase H-like HicB family nuclease
MIDVDIVRVKPGSIKDGIVITVPLYVKKDANGFVGYSPFLRGLLFSGDTVEELHRKAHDAVTAFLWSLAKHGELMPNAKVAVEFHWD